MRISEREAHNCLASLKLEVAKLQQTAKARILFYTSGGTQDYHVFNESTLDWSKHALTGEFMFPILAQFIVLNPSAKQPGPIKVFGLGGLKEFQSVKQEGNVEITEKTTDPCKDVFEVYMSL